MNSLWLTLQTTTLTTAAATLCALLGRRGLRTWFGAQWAYAFWLIVPLAGVAAVLPHPAGVPSLVRAALTTLGAGDTVRGVIEAWPRIDEGLLVQAWGGGCLLSLAVLAWQQYRFERWLDVPSSPAVHHSHRLRHAPVVVGLWVPRIVLPADFEVRYTAEQRALILAHERLHLERRDPLSNALALLLRSVFWFNPLLRVAYARFRLDQELACDAQLFRQWPAASRGAYARAILQTQGIGVAVPAGLAWTTNNQIKERLMHLKRGTPRLRLNRVASAGLWVLIGAGVTYAAWATQPLVQTVTAGAGPSTGSAVRISLSSQSAVRAADGGLDLSGHAVVTATTGSLQIRADWLQSSDIEGGHQLQADGHVQIGIGPHTLTTAHALIKTGTGTSSIAMDSGHIDNLGLPPAR